LARFRRTARAEDDLIEIWLYIARDNQKRADTLLDKIDQACALLAAHPAIGPARPDLAPELRYSTVGRYLILYREIAGGIEVVRIVHGARHLPDLI
jgi:toxin ParE1/3/4